MQNQKDEENNLIEGIFELHRTIMNIYFKDFEESYQLPAGLNPTHMRALLLLNFHGNLTMTGLSRMLSLEKGSFTSVAARLEKMELVKKERSSQDKRVYHLVLTKTGQKLASVLKGNHWEFISGRLDKISQEEQKDYFSMVTALNHYNEKIRKS